MRYISNTQSATEFIKRGLPFQGNSMSAFTYSAYMYGRLPLEWRKVLDANFVDIDYIVYSFATPIAWRLKGDIWVMPAVTYSGFTSRHQFYVRRYLWSRFMPYERVEADMYYNANTILSAIHALQNGERAPIMHTNRHRDTVTVRGLKPGDYLYDDETGNWVPMYYKEKRSGVLGRTYWVGICRRDAKSTVTVYIGEHTEKVGRLR